LTVNCCVHPLWATIVGHPHISIIICRVQLAQATSQLCQWAGIDCVRHQVRLSTGTQVKVGLLPSLPAGTTITLHSAEGIQDGPLSSSEVKTSLSMKIEGGIQVFPPPTFDVCWIRVLTRLIPGWPLAASSMRVMQQQRKLCCWFSTLGELENGRFMFLLIWFDAIWFSKK